MNLHSKIYGDKETHLIVIHGLFGMSDNWNTLGKKFNIITKYLIDLRNHEDLHFFSWYEVMMRL